MKVVKDVQNVTEYLDNLTQEDIDNLSMHQVIVECVNPNCRNYVKLDGRNAEDEDIYRRGQKISDDCVGLRITRNREGELKANRLKGVYKKYCSNKCAVVHEL